MNQERYVAAIEVSSSKIIGVVGRTRGTGHLDIVAIEQEKGVEFSRHGIIQNLEEASLRVARIIEKLERNPGVAPRRIRGVFTGLSGRSMRNITVVVDEALPVDTEITDDIINTLRNRAQATATDSSLEVIDVIPQSYKVGRVVTPNPRGAVGDHIEATYDLIVVRKEMRRNLERTIPDKLGIEIDGLVVTALAAGQIILSEEEKRLGCMLVDMGAETTTVTIYRNGHLEYYATIPLGGRNITRDITSLNILEERAEELKITSGNAISRETPSTLNYNGIKMSDVSNRTVARAEEIVANIVEQIHYDGLTDKDLPGGIVCIGGAAKLNGITDLLSQKSDLKVRRGQLPAYIRIDDIKGSNTDLLQVASILYAGAMDSDIESLELPHKEELPPTGTPNPEEEKEVKKDKPGSEPPLKIRSNGLFNKLGSKLANLFGGNDTEDDSDLLD